MKNKNNKKKRKIIELNTNYNQNLINNKNEINIFNKLRNINNLNYIYDNFFGVVPKQKKKKFSIKPKNIFKKNQTHLDFDVSLDFSKFDSVFFEEHSRIDTQQNINTNVLKLLDEDYNQYIKSLKKIYPIFKFNHSAKFPLIKNNKNIEKKENENNIIENNIDNFEYFTPKEIINLFNEDKNYLINPNLYKLNSELLEKNNIKELNKIIKFFDKKIQHYEIILNKILIHSNCIINWILNNNYLEFKIIKYQNEIKLKREKEKNSRKKFIKSYGKSILLKIKKNNILNSLKQIKKINEIYNKFKSINFSTLNLNQENILISEIQSEIVKYKNLNKNVKILNYIDKEINLKINVSESKYINSFVSIIDEILKICFPFNNNLNNINENINEENKFNLNYDKILNNNFSLNYNNNKLIINNLKNFPINSKQKLINLCQNYSFILSQGFDILNIIEKLKNIFSLYFMDFKKIKDFEKILNLYKIFIENYLFILDIISNNFGTTKKTFNELTEFIYKDVKNYIKNYINNYFNNNIIITEIEKYIKNRNYLKNLIINFFTIDLNEKYDENNFNQFDNDFIFKFFTFYSDNLNDLFEKENFIEKNNFSEYYQKILNIILKDFTNLNENDLKLNINNFNNNNKNFLEIKEEKLKTISSLLSILNFIYNVYKIIFYFKEKDYLNTILIQLIKILNNFISKIYNLIIENKKGKIFNREINEKDFLLLNSICLILQNILFNFFTLVQNNDNIIKSINKIINELNLIQIKCEEILNKNLQNILNEIMNEFEKLDFKNYPNFKEKDFNSYIKKFNKIKNFYDLMLNCLEKKKINEIFKKFLEKFFINFNYKCQMKGTIENEKMLKQFRFELNYLKNIIKMFELNENEKFINLIDEISINSNPKITN